MTSSRWKKCSRAREMKTSASTSSDSTSRRRIFRIGSRASVIRASRQLLDDLLRRFQDIKNLARQTGNRDRGRGDFYDGKTRPAYGALEKSLESDPVQGPPSSRRGRGDGAIDLNRHTPVAQSPGTKVEYEVKVSDLDHPVSSRIELQGGEALELYLSEDASRLQHRRYDKEERGNYPQLSDPSDPGNPLKSFYIGAHLPRWSRDDVEFSLSVQNSDPLASALAPEEVWVQVPSGHARRGPRKVAYNFTTWRFERAPPFRFQLPGPEVAA